MVEKTAVSLRGRVPPALPAKDFIAIEARKKPGVTWLVDADFLSSSWNCIYGNGCKGIPDAENGRLCHGCCTYGAHMVDEEEARRIEQLAARMPAKFFQYKEVASRKGVLAKSGRALKTRVIEGACIFLNRKGFPTGPGCSLHLWAASLGKRPMKLKPTVCWQLPLKVEYLTSDGHTYCILRRWERRDWGEAGFDFSWWCTEGPEAFSGQRPVFEEMASELIEICGPKVYERIASCLRERLASKPGSSRSPRPSPPPAHGEAPRKL